MNTLTASRLIASGNGQPLFTLHCDFGQEQCRAMLKSCLIPCGSFATHLPCPSYQPGLCDQYCERHVFYSEEQKKFVACCPDCSAPDFTVEEEDMRMFMVSGAYVAKELSSALQIDGQPECLPNKRTWFIGEIASSASRRHPVYLEFSAVSSTITSDIKDLLLFEIEKPSLILTTGKYAPNAALTRLLKSRHCILACADDFADIRDDCSFTPKQDVKILFKDFVEEAKSDEKKSAGFDFPKGKTWENLRIHFLDGHTLTFDVNGSISTHTREEMDLGNAQWQM